MCVCVHVCGRLFVCVCSLLMVVLNSQLSYTLITWLPHQDKANNVVKAIKTNKCAGSDATVGEFIKYGSKPMFEILLTQFNLGRSNEYIPTYILAIIEVKIY